MSMVRFLAPALLLLALSACSGRDEVRSPTQVVTQAATGAVRTVAPAAAGVAVSAATANPVAGRAARRATGSAISDREQERQSGSVLPQ